MKKEPKTYKKEPITVKKECSVEEIASKLRVLPKLMKWIVYGTSLTDAHGSREVLFLTPQQLADLLLKVDREKWKWMLNSTKDCLSKYSDYIMISEASSCGEFEESSSKKHGVRTDKS